MNSNHGEFCLANVVIPDSKSLMQFIRFILGYISPFVMFAGVLMIASGIKGEPLNLSLAAWGVGVLVIAAFTFPRPGHPFFEALARDRGKKSDMGQAIETPTRAEEYDKWVKAHQEEERALFERARAKPSSDAVPDMTVVQAAAAETPDDTDLKPDYSGWCRLDPVIGTSGGATSWIGGRPKMPDDIAWPHKNGLHAVFAAQVAVADLPDDIWGGIGPKSGWLLFFIAPYGKRATVIHTDEPGPEREYPAENVFMNYLNSSRRHALASCGRYLGSYEPPKWEVKISPASECPPSRFERYRLGEGPSSALGELDLTAHQLSELGAPPEADLCTLDFLAGEIYNRHPEALAPEIRSAVEADWRVDAHYEAATMSGPLPGDFPYSDLENPVLLLQLQASVLIGWDFGDLGRYGIFIKPADLKAGRWHKAWGDVAN